MLDILSNRHWASLRASELIPKASSLALLAPEGLCFFLPAYMLATLESYDLVDVIPDNLLFALTPERGNELRFSSLMSCLTDDQKTVVRLFIQYLADLDPLTYAQRCEQALASFPEPPTQ